MSEVVEPTAAPAVAAGGAGRLLREAREAAGLHVAALAVALKVPVRKLEALEAERFDEVGEPVFVRGLAGSVCRALKVPAQPVLERLPQGTQPRLVADSEGINEPFRAAGDGAPPSWVNQLTRPVFLAVFALLLGALVLLLLPMAQHSDEKTAGAPVPTAAAPAAPLAVPGAPAPTAAGPAPAEPAVKAVSPSPASAQAASQPPAPDASASPVAGATASPARTSTTAPDSAAATAPAGLPAVSTASPAVPQAPSAAGSAAAAGTASPGSAAGGLVSFRATGASWVEVSEAGGAVVLRRTLGAGETASAGGNPPLKVTIGKADQTQVLVRGRAFDLQPFSHDNVARFEVK